MKTRDGQARPSDLIDKIEMCITTNKTISITPKQARDLWGWIEDIEDELNDRRMNSTPPLVPFQTVHDDPNDYVDENGDWLTIQGDDNGR